mgnify:CR=1 FL=1
MDKISDGSKLMLVFGIFHQKTWDSDGPFNEVFILYILVVGWFDVLSGGVSNHSLEKTVMLLSKFIIWVFSLVFLRGFQFFKDLEKQFNYFGHFDFFNKHGDFIGLDILLKISIDGEAKDITSKFFIGQKFD